MVQLYVFYVGFVDGHVTISQRLGSESSSLAKGQRITSLLVNSVLSWKLKIYVLNIFLTKIITIYYHKLK